MNGFWVERTMIPLRERRYFDAATGHVSRCFRHRITVGHRLPSFADSKITCRFSFLEEKKMPDNNAVRVRRDLAISLQTTYRRSRSIPAKPSACSQITPKKRGADLYTELVRIAIESAKVSPDLSTVSLIRLWFYTKSLHKGLTATTWKLQADRALASHLVLGPEHPRPPRRSNPVKGEMSCLPFQPRRCSARQIIRCC
jgi:hypothetical protein